MHASCREQCSCSQTRRVDDNWIQMFRQADGCCSGTRTRARLGMQDRVRCCLGFGFACTHCRKVVHDDWSSSGDCGVTRSIRVPTLVIVVCQKRIWAYSNGFKRGGLVDGSSFLFVKRMLSGTSCSTHTPTNPCSFRAMCRVVIGLMLLGLCLPGPNFVRPSR
jgi:hypothetical protein